MATPKQGLPTHSGGKSPARKKSGRSGRARESPKEVKSTRPTRDRFEISVHPREGTYVGKIWHPFSKRTEQLKGLDGTHIVSFISDCLPSPRVEEPEAPTTAAPVRSAAGVLKELEAQQGDRHDPVEEIVLQPGKPFSVIARIHLAAPPRDPIPFNVPEYSVSLIARRPDKVGEVAEGMAVGTLTPGQAEYESCIEMPALRAGRYVLDAYTRVPLASVAESERVPLQVG